MDRTAVPELSQCLRTGLTGLWRDKKILGQPNARFVFETSDAVISASLQQFERSLKDPRFGDLRVAKDQIAALKSELRALVRNASGRTPEEQELARERERLSQKVVDAQDELGGAERSRKRMIQAHERQVRQRDSDILHWKQGLVQFRDVGADLKRRFDAIRRSVKAPFSVRAAMADLVGEVQTAALAPGRVSPAIEAEERAVAEARVSADKRFEEVRQNGRQLAAALGVHIRCSDVGDADDVKRKFGEFLAEKRKAAVEELRAELAARLRCDGLAVSGQSLAEAVEAHLRERIVEKEERYRALIAGSEEKELGLRQKMEQARELLQSLQAGEIQIDDDLDRTYRETDERLDSLIGSMTLGGSAIEGDMLRGLPGEEF